MRAPTRPAEMNHFYRTPPATTRALLAVERFGATVWEPSCGDGLMARELESAGYEVIASDLIDRGYGEVGVDFLRSERAGAPSLVTNPPFHLADEFLKHAIRLGVEKIAMLGPIQWLAGKRRHDSLWSIHPPSRVWVFSSRQTLWRGDEEKPAGANSGTTTYAWFVLDRTTSIKAAPIIGWLT